MLVAPVSEGLPRVPSVINHSVVGADGDAVRPDELAFAPGMQEVPFAIEHDDRVLPPVERIHTIV
jgi:hypothetical protein